MTSWPLSYLDAAGPAAAPLTQLAWGLGGISLAVVLIVAGALAGAIWRKRDVIESATPLQSLGPRTGGMIWIYVGVPIASVVLLGCTIWTLVVLGQVLHPARPSHLTLQIRAHQWWWEVRYLSPNGDIFTTANEIHIPAGEPVRIELSSTDVIHSFWVPKLAGKMDVIPGVTNVTWVEAAEPGIFRGQCGEFCGLQHAHMAFQLVADTPASYIAWKSHQLESPALLSSGLTTATAKANAGEAIFAARCAACHTIVGTSAGGLVGPDLSHVASRNMLAAGMIPNDHDHLSAWIADPQSIKPGARMPAVALDPTERGEVVAYLETLT